LNSMDFSDSDQFHATKFINFENDAIIFMIYLRRKFNY